MERWLTAALQVVILTGDYCYADSYFPNVRLPPVLRLCRVFVRIVSNHAACHAQHSIEKIQVQLSGVKYTLTLSPLPFCYGTVYQVLHRAMYTLFISSYHQ